MHFTLPAPSIDLHERMEGGARSSDTHPPTSQFPGVYIAGFLQQQRVFAQVELPGPDRQGSADVIVFPTDWREQRRVIIAPTAPLSSFSEIRRSFPSLDASHCVADYSADASGCVCGFLVPNSFHASVTSVDLHAAQCVSWTLHDVRGGQMIASCSTPTQPPIL